MTDLLALLQSFRQRMTGQYVRGQRITGVELIIEGLDQHEFRYHLSVVFAEHPTTETSPEMNLLERVFCEIPASARVCTDSLDELEGWLNGSPIEQWKLDDER